MNIQKTNNNQPSFQMRCVFRKHWNPEILSTFENSKIVKELDKYFPDAKAYYDSYINAQRVYCPSILVKLDKDSFFKISADKKFISNPELDFHATNKQLAERINNATLEQVHSALIKGKVSLKKTAQVIKKLQNTSILDVSNGFKESNSIKEIKSNPFLNLLRKIFYRDK